MAVSLSVTGRLCTLDRRAEAVRFARERAADLEWRCEDVSYSFPAADVREGGRTRRVAPFRASGVVLLPHFACEPLPLLFADDEATLLDAYVHEGDDGRKTFEGGALVNTQFAGAAVHREICEFLTELQRETGCTFRVDDETGWYASRDDAAQERAFAAAWEAVRARLERDAPAAGTAFDVGGFPFIAPDGRRRGEFDAVPAELADRIRGFEATLATLGAETGLKFDRTAGSAEDLELMASDFADPSSGYGDDDAREGAANHLGAAFGRLVAATLGGHWRASPEHGLALFDVGGVGLVVDPIVVGLKRLTEGPVHSLTNHYAAYAAVVRGLAGASGSPA